MGLHDLSLKSWTVKLEPSEIDLCNKAIDNCIEKTDATNKREATLKIIMFYLNQFNELVITDDEVITRKLVHDEQIERFCELGFLKKIVDKKDGINKWFCLKLSSPTSKGRPFLMADGNDIESIQTLCNACKNGYMFQLQRELGTKAIQAIRDFGDKKITVNIYCCTHKDNEYIQAKLGTVGTFYCKKSEVREKVDDCEINVCEFLIINKSEIKIRETEPFKELQKELEDKSEGN